MKKGGNYNRIVIVLKTFILMNFQFFLIIKTTRAWGKLATEINSSLREILFFLYFNHSYQIWKFLTCFEELVNLQHFFVFCGAFSWKCGTDDERNLSIFDIFLLVLNNYFHFTSSNSTFNFWSQIHKKWRKRKGFLKPFFWKRSIDQKKIKLIIW